MTATAVTLLAQLHADLHRHLEEHLPLSHLAGAGTLNESVRYAVFPGGRRWRPALTILGAAVTGIKPDHVMRVACGVEFVHSASLILDDLPAMDDGRERRGQPTVHLAFGEGVALLTALALLNRGYELFLSPVPGAPAGCGARVLRAATRAIGVDGMIGGQAIDLASPAGASLATRDRKTTALVAFAASAGAMAAGADEQDVAALARYGEHLGAAYQMHDDLDDGQFAAGAFKTAGQDARHGRASWATRGSRTAVRASAADAVARARLAIADRFGEREAAALLIQAAESILDVRDRSLAARDAG